MKNVEAGAGVPVFYQLKQAFSASVCPECDSGLDEHLQVTGMSGASWNL